MSIATQEGIRPAVLQASGLSKEYEGIQALGWTPDSGIQAVAGEIHAVVGENGAGKSTLMSILAGLVSPTTGALRLDGHDYAPGSVADSRALGVEIVVQDLGLIGSLTVAENFFLGRKALDSRLGLVSRRRGRQLVRKTLAAVAPHVSANTLASTLNLEDQKLVELARAVHFAPKVLLVDEMSACLSRSGLHRLFDVLRDQSAKGVAVLYISHYLEEVKELCDRVTVLRDGRVIATLPTDDVDERRLTSLMVGRELAATLYPQDTPARDFAEERLLEVRNLTLDGAYQDITLSVHRGEILGIGGLVGCGSDPLARTIFGAIKARSGTMTLDNSPFKPRSPRQAVNRGVAYVPPDRDREGLLLRLPIATNVTLAILTRLARGGVYGGRREPRIVQRLIRDLAIKCRSERDLPLQLSGGNRQKVVLAKWLLTESSLFMLHNPTRGIDVGAKAEIYQLMQRLAEQGAAVILISDELHELIGMSDRILIMRRGELSHHVGRPDAPTEDDLITYMV